VHRQRSNSIFKKQKLFIFSHFLNHKNNSQEHDFYTPPEHERVGRRGPHAGRRGPLKTLDYSL
jgi:hypothetical protein